MKLPKLALNSDSSKWSGNSGNTVHRGVAIGLQVLPPVNKYRQQVATFGVTPIKANEVLPLLPVEKIEWQQLQPNKSGVIASVASVAIEKQSTEFSSEPALHLRWLDGLAALLHCEASYLLEHGFIDCHDLVEQDGSNLPVMAALMRSNPAWIPQFDRHQLGRPYAKAVTTFTAAVSSPEWVLVRDDYHNHWADCLDCYPPTGRYCTTGADLKARYATIIDQGQEQTA